MTTIVLVHGLWADGSVWDEVMIRLQDRGHTVVSAQLPLTSFEDDVAALGRTLQTVPGRTAVVAWSYGGAVVSASELPETVTALGFVAAFLPERGESVGALAHRRPSELLAAVRTSADGFTWIERDRYPELVMNGVTDRVARVRSSAQKLAHGSVLGSPVERASWQSIPSHYLLATRDRAIAPDTQREMAERAGSSVVESDTGHAAMLSRPEEVVAFIETVADRADRS